MDHLYDWQREAMKLREHIKLLRRALERLLPLASTGQSAIIEAALEKTKE